MASPLALAQDLVARLLALDVQPDPLATMTGTIIVGGQRATPVTVDVLEVRAAEACTLLRWRLRSSTAQRDDTVGSWMSRPGLLDTQGIQVLIAEAVLQPYTYPGPDGGAFDAAGDAFCACPVLPTVVGTEGVLMPAVLPPMPAGALMVDAALSGIAPAAGVPVIQPRWFVLVLLMLLTACTGGGDPGSMPRPDATHEVASGSPAPAGYAAQSVGELTFSVPGPWRAVETPPIKVPAGGADVVMQVALRAPASGGAASPVALALLTSKPSRPAAQAVKALLAIKRDVEKAQVLAVQSLSLEGFTNATLVAFVESGAAGQQRTDVLIGDLPSGAVVNLTVIASPETFEAEGLGAIALSARATGRPAEHPGAVVLRCCSAATYRSDRMNHRRAGHG